MGADAGTAPGSAPARFEPGQVVTVFRSRLHPDHVDEYGALAPEVEDLARAMPGFVDCKGFAADDGERVTIVTFADAPSQAAWRHQADHAAARAAGRDRFYAAYSLQVCTCDRVSTLGPGPG